jgi:Asp/Glu/hydantoin racemase
MCWLCGVHHAKIHHRRNQMKNHRNQILRARARPLDMFPDHPDPYNIRQKLWVKSPNCIKIYCADTLILGFAHKAQIVHSLMG